MNSASMSLLDLTIDVEMETNRICEVIVESLAKKLRRRGLVVGISGGIDSSVTLALAVKALGPERVLALQMPERHSAQETLGLSSKIADHFGVEKKLEDITEILNAVGFYKRYDDTIRDVVPEYGANWKSKIVLPDARERSGFSVFSLVAEAPDGTQVRKRLELSSYLSIVAATNFKQRIRKMLEYYHADRLNYAVTGTPNRLEYDQGFFVKLGDGAADIKPIAHLYKTQVYQIAEHLGIPEEIRLRPPTTDTYSLPQGQDEFYFSLPYKEMDLCLYGKNSNIEASVVAAAINLPEEAVSRVYSDIDQKRRTTRYLHMKPILIEDVSEVRSN